MQPCSASPARCCARWPPSYGINTSPAPCPNPNVLQYYFTMASSSQAPHELPRNLACAITLKARQMEQAPQPAALLLMPQSRALMAFRRIASGKTKVIVARWTESEGRCTVEAGLAVHLTLDSSATAPNQHLVEWLRSWVGGSSLRKVLLNCGTLDAMLGNQLPVEGGASVLACPERHSNLFPWCGTGNCSSISDHILWAQRIVSFT